MNEERMNVIFSLLKEEWTRTDPPPTPLPTIDCFEDPRRRRFDFSNCFTPLYLSDFVFKFDLENDGVDLNKLENYGTIPSLVIHKIFLFLTPKDLYKAMQTCKVFYHISHTRLFWKVYYQIHNSRRIRIKKKQWKIRTDCAVCRDQYFLEGCFYCINEELKKGEVTSPDPTEDDGPPRSEDGLPKYIPPSLFQQLMSCNHPSVYGMQGLINMVRMLPDGFVVQKHKDAPVLSGDPSSCDDEEEFCRRSWKRKFYDQHFRLVDRVYVEKFDKHPYSRDNDKQPYSRKDKLNKKNVLIVPITSSASTEDQRVEREMTKEFPDVLNGIVGYYDRDELTLKTLHEFPKTPMADNNSSSRYGNHEGNLCFEEKMYLNYDGIIFVCSVYNSNVVFDRVKEICGRIMVPKTCVCMMIGYHPESSFQKTESRRRTRRRIEFSEFVNFSKSIFSDRLVGYLECGLKHNAFVALRCLIDAIKNVRKEKKKYGELFSRK